MVSNRRGGKMNDRVHVTVPCPPLGSDAVLTGSNTGYNGREYYRERTASNASAAKRPFGRARQGAHHVTDDAEQKFLSMALSPRQIS